MLLTYDEAHKGYYPLVGDEVAEILRQSAPRFWEAIPVTRSPKGEIELKYFNESMQSASTSVNEPIVPNVPMPSVFPTDLVQNGWADRHTIGTAFWEHTTYIRSYLHSIKQDYFNQGESMIDLRNNLELFGRKIIRDIINQSSTPAAGDIGSIAANLAGWTDFTSGKINGYDASVLSDQTVTVPGSGKIFEYDVTSGGITSGNMGSIDDAMELVPGGNLWVVPNRFLKAMRENWRRRGMLVVENTFQIMNMLQVAGAPIFTQNVPLLEGIPMLVLPDSVFSDAGHDMITPDYDIYLLRVSADPFGGCGLRYWDQGYENNNRMTQLGMGVWLRDLGPITDSGGAWTVDGKQLTGNFQFMIGRPDSACIITGVKD